MYVKIHVYMYVCIYVHTNIYICMWKYMCICTCVCMYLPTYIYVCENTWPTNIYICMWKYMCICTCVYMYLPTHIYVCENTCVYIRVYICTYQNIYIYMKKYMCINTCVNMYIPTYVYVSKNTSVYVCVYIHTSQHICIDRFTFYVFVYCCVFFLAWDSTSYILMQVDIINSQLATQFAREHHCRTYVWEYLPGRNSVDNGFAVYVCLTMGWKKFWQVRSIAKFHCQFSSKLTFENFYQPRTLIDGVGVEKFSKVGSTEKSSSKLSSELTLRICTSSRFRTWWHRC